MKLVKLTKKDCTELQEVMEQRIYNGLFNMKAGYHSVSQEMIDAFNVLAFLSRSMPCDVEEGAAPLPKKQSKVA